MKKLLLGLAACTLLAFASVAQAQTTTTTIPSCQNGGIKCDAQCDNSDTCPGGTGGISFTGVCAGANGDLNAAGKTCLYTHCNSSTPVCIGGPWTTQGCSADGACASNEACISSSGNAGCGTGYSQCVAKCTNSTTTSTTVTTTTSTVTTTT